MSTPGWYPDPGGVPNLYRYWDGRAWTTQLSPQPGPPTAPPTGSYGPTGPQGPVGTTTPGFGQLPPTKRRGRGWLIGLIALGVAIIVVVVLAVRGLSGVIGGGSRLPGGNPSADVCPKPEASSTSTPQPNDGRVHSGPLSYPRLGAPWGAPLPNSEVPFGRDVQQQFLQTERTPTMRWGAAVMVGELVAGDGFFAPKDGAEIVLRCVTGTFYGNAAVTRNDTKSQAITIDGHDAWIMESDLSFSIPGLKAKNELLTVVIVDLKNGSAGLFAASVPGNFPQYNAAAEASMKGLRVS